jgi:hypothetical protein
MSTKIYLDECGYTGDDLWDDDQPVFVIATHSVDEAQCTELKRKFFGAVRAPELKHAILQRRGQHCRSVVSFLTSLLDSQNQVRVVFAHKRFALTAKLVDFLIEPVAHRAGFDFYKDRMNWAFANLLFFGLQTENSTTLSHLLRRFQRLVRERSPASLRDLQTFVEQPALLPIVDEMLDMVRAPARLTRISDIEQLPPRLLDLSFSVALSALYTWRAAGFTSIHVVHDRSTNMARQTQLWEWLLAPNAPEALVGYGVTGFEFPIGVESTAFVDSKESDGVQVADVVAGALARWTRWLMCGRPDTDPYGKALHGVFERRVEQWMVHAIWPSMDDVGHTPAAPGLGDPLEYITKRIEDFESLKR